MNSCSSLVVCYVEFGAEDGEKSRFSPQNHVDWSVHGETKGGGQLSSEFAPLIREIGQNRGLERVEQLELRVLAFVCLLIENKLVPRSPVSVSAPRRVRAIKVQKCPGWVLCGEGGGVDGRRGSDQYRYISLDACYRCGGGWKRNMAAGTPRGSWGRGSIKPNANVGIPHAIFPPRPQLPIALSFGESSLMSCWWRNLEYVRLTQLLTQMDKEQGEAGGGGGLLVIDGCSWKVLRDGIRNEISDASSLAVQHSHYNIVFCVIIENNCPFYFCKHSFFYKRWGPKAAIGWHE